MQVSRDSEKKYTSEEFDEMTTLCEATKLSMYPSYDGLMTFQWFRYADVIEFLGYHGVYEIEDGKVNYV